MYLEVALKVNNFAEIVLVERFNKVNYYTVSINEQVPLFMQFIANHDVVNREKLNHILTWIRLIGEKIGAKENYFRNESETAYTSALPPLGKDRHPAYIEIDDAGFEHNTPNNLRLYCMRVSESVVFLFNGDIKTAAKAQDCDNVRPYFKLANQLTALIDQAFIEKEIFWDDDSADILFEEGFCLTW